MAPDTRAATPLLDEVATGVDNGTKRSKEMGEESTRRTNRGCDVSNLTGYSTRKLAVGASVRCLSRERWPYTCREATSWVGDIDGTSDETVSP